MVDFAALFTCVFIYTCDPQETVKDQTTLKNAALKQDIRKLKQLLNHVRASKITKTFDERQHRKLCRC